MNRVNDVFNILTELCPVEAALPEDKVGLIVGDGNAEVTRILVALDITMAVIDEAVSIGADLIVSHHAMPYRPLQRVVAGEINSDKVIKLIKNGISTISMHTNLDAAIGGVNDALAEAIGLEDIGPFDNSQAPSIGRIGYVRPELSLEDFLAKVKKDLNAGGLRYVVGSGRVSKVAVGSGNCSGFWQDAIACGCDTFLSGDFKYNALLDAEESGLVNIVDGGHFPTENVICPKLVSYLKSKLSDVDVILSSVHEDPVRFFI